MNSQKKLKAALACAWLADGPLRIKELCGIVAEYGNAFEGNCVLSLQAQVYGVRLLTALPEHKLAGADYRTVYVWDTVSGELLHRLMGHVRFICKLVVMGKEWLASAALDKTVRIWDVVTGSCVHTLELHGMPNDLTVWNGDLAAATGNTVRMWSLSRRAWSCLFEGHRETVNVVAALSSERLATGSRDETVRVWSHVDGKCVHILQGHSHHVTALIRLPDNQLASSSQDCTVKVWDTLHGVCLFTLEGHTRSVEVLAFNGKLISRSHDRTVRVWDLVSGARSARKASVHMLQSGAKSVYDVAVMPGGLLAACSEDTVQVWDMHTGAMCCELPDHLGEVLSVAVLPNGRLASGSGGKVRVWE